MFGKQKGPKPYGISYDAFCRPSLKETAEELDAYREGWERIFGNKKEEAEEKTIADGNPKT